MYVIVQYYVGKVGYFQSDSILFSISVGKTTKIIKRDHRMHEKMLTLRTVDPLKSVYAIALSQVAGTPAGAVVRTGRAYSFRFRDH